MYHKPTLDLGTALTVFCILFALTIASVLSGCTTAKQSTTPPVGEHAHRHDARTKTAEPYNQPRR